jgi:hypothetical protein
MLRNSTQTTTTTQSLQSANACSRARPTTHSQGDGPRPLSCGWRERLASKSPRHTHTGEPASFEQETTSGEGQQLTIESWAFRIRTSPAWCVRVRGDWLGAALAAGSSPGLFAVDSPAARHRRDRSRRLEPDQRCGLSVASSAPAVPIKRAGRPPP